jgi:protein TonB
MLLVICAHIIVVAVVLSTKMTMPPRVTNSPTPIISVPLPKPPPPRPVATVQPNRPRTPLDQVSQPPVALPNPSPVPTPAGSTSGGGPIVGGDFGVPTVPTLPPLPLPKSSAAQLLTPLSDLKPPYPEAKLLTGEEAVLTLRVSIDESGRVIAVDPVGRADPIFLAAARRHLLAHWRYRPAMKDGRPVASTTVITLRFELDG